MTSSDTKTCNACGRMLSICQCGTTRVVIDEATAASLKDAVPSTPLIFYYLGRAYEHRKINKELDQSDGYQKQYKNDKARAAYRNGAELAESLGATGWVKGKAYAEYGESLRVQSPEDLSGSLSYLNRAIELLKGESDEKLKEAQVDDLVDACQDAANTACKMKDADLAEKYISTAVNVCESHGLTKDAKKCRDELAEWMRRDKIGHSANAREDKGANTAD